MKTRGWLSLFVLTLMLTCPPPSRPQTGALGDSVLVSNIISDFEESLGGITDNFEDAYSSSAFLTRQQLQVLTWELQAMGEGLVGKTFGELKPAQKDFFRRVQSTIAEWNKGNRQALAQVDQLLVKANDVLGTIPGAYRQPRVTGYAPLYLEARNNTFMVRVKGSWLGNGEPSLALGNTRCRRQGMIESELSFSCKLDLSKSNRLTTRSANLTVYETPSSWWGKALSWVGMEDLDPKQYEIALMVVPSTLGSYTIKVTREQEVREPQRRSQRFRHQNDHCQRSRRKTWNFSASSGWRIDPGSVKFSYDKNRESAWSGLENLTEAGFQLKATIRNQGSCAPRVLGHRAYVDGRGQVWGHADWTEYKLVKRQVEEQGPSGKLEWGRDIEIPLPQGTVAYAVTVHQVNGQRHVAMGEESRKWFSLVDDSPARLVLHPQALAIALAD